VRDALHAFRLLCDRVDLVEPGAVAHLIGLCLVLLLTALWIWGLFRCLAEGLKKPEPPEPPDSLTANAETHRRSLETP
jgi:hypothetical protein